MRQWKRRVQGQKASPTMFTAIQNQLGLTEKTENRRARRPRNFQPGLAVEGLERRETLSAFMMGAGAVAFGGSAAGQMQTNSMLGETYGNEGETDPGTTTETPSEPETTMTDF